jgi:hypothetical protein
MNKDLAHRRVADSLVARSPPLIRCYLYAPTLTLLYRPVDAIAKSTVNFTIALCEAALSTVDRGNQRHARSLQHQGGVDPHEN